MNKKVFLRSLKCALHPEETLHGTRRLEPEEWSQILAAASEHAVLPMVYEAVWQKQSFQKVPKEVRDIYKMQMKQQIVRQMRMTDLFLDLYKRLTRLGITPLVMKGIICRNMYPSPDYRMSSDEDLLIPREQFPKLDQILLQCGFQRENIENIQKEYEVTYYHPRNGLHLEVHMSLFPKESGSYGRLNAEFTQVYERQTTEVIQDVEIHTLDVTQHMLYLLCHGLKHFLHSGFGIRQLCDMIMFAETYGDEIDWVEVKRSTRRQHMYIFWMNLFDIGERYLGFSWEKAGLLPPQKDILDSEAMLEDILDSGIFGKSSRERMHSANITLQASDRNEKKRSGLIESLFPNVEYMSRNYTYLEKHKEMLPIAWVQRLLTYQKRMSGRDITKPLEKGRQRVELLKKYGMIDE